MSSEDVDGVTAGQVSTAAWSGTWVLTLPLKRLQRAKSRVLLPPDLRGSLALAMALDTAEAVLGCPAVSAVRVVCADDIAAQAFDRLGCQVVRDPEDGGLNEVLAAECSHVRAVSPGSGFASLMADVPALRSADLSEALARAGRHPRSFVADASGGGTTLLAALPGAPYVPAYGPASSEAHRLGGSTPLQLRRGTSLRRDVDTLGDLARASADGVGPHTSRLLGEVLATVGPSSRDMAG